MAEDIIEKELRILRSVDYIRGLKSNESGNISLADLFQSVFYTSGENVETNIDNYKRSGIYGINRDDWANTNSPIIYGCLLVFNGEGLSSGGNPIVQIAVSHDAMVIKVRIHWVRGWYDWRNI